MMSISKSSFRKLPSPDTFPHLHYRNRPHHPAASPSPPIYTCLAIFFLSLLVFLHCHDPSLSSMPSLLLSHHSLPKISQISHTHFSNFSSQSSSPARRSALRGLGTVFRLGTSSMNELVVAHVSESTSQKSFRAFLRTLHRSGVTAKADVVFLFASSPLPTSMTDVLFEEDYWFRRLLLGRIRGDFPQHSAANSSQILPNTDSNHLTSNATFSPFNVNAFRKASLDNASSIQPLWGWRSGNPSPQPITADEDSRIVWGSMVGFDASELNPEDALEGFIDHPPLQLRRWACYQMLLGMVRHKFKQVLLTEVDGVLVLRDPLTVARRKVGLYLSLEDRTWGTSIASELGVVNESRNNTHNADISTDQIQLLSKNREGNADMKRRQLRTGIDTRRKGGRRRSRRRSTAGLYEKVYGKEMWSTLEEVEKNKRLVNSGAIVGGIQQVRGLANTMVTEIVKVALERKKRDPFPDKVLLSYLLHKSTVLGKRVMEHLHLMENADSFVHSLIGSEQRSLFFKKNRQPYAMIHGCNKSKQWSSAANVVANDICSSPGDGIEYKDCQRNV